MLMGGLLSCVEFWSKRKCMFQKIQILKLGLDVSLGSEFESFLLNPEALFGIGSNKER